MARVSRQSAIYWALLAASFAVALTASWTGFGAQIDNDAYDWMFRAYQPPAWQPESILLAIDEPSLNAYGGVPGIRKPLAEALRLIAAASPKTVAVDLILADNTDPATDARLGKPWHGTRNLVLACQLMPDGRLVGGSVAALPRAGGRAGACPRRAGRAGFGGPQPAARRSCRTGSPLGPVVGGLPAEPRRPAIPDHGIAARSGSGRPGDSFRAARAGG